MELISKILTRVNTGPILIDSNCVMSFLAGGPPDEDVPPSSLLPLFAIVASYINLQELNKIQLAM